MDLKIYIQKNYRNPNPVILKVLGASDELIQYLRYTTHNTNGNIWPQLCSDKGNVGIVCESQVCNCVVG